MNGKKGSIEIDIPPSTKTEEPESCRSPGDCAYWVKASVWSVWEFCKEDSNRVIFSLKVGLAVLLVSLLILFQAPYDVFGSNIIWSILTVAIMFEYTVGATFNRGFNRALGSLLAGILAIAVAQVALRTGHVAEPIIIGVSIFVIGTVTSFMKLWPSLAPYEYGFRVILFTYCLIIVSGYRMGNPARTAMDRLYSIAIGAFVAVVVNVVVFPIWAGEQLHKELVSSFNSVADSLEECVKKYLEDDGSQNPEFSKTVMDEFTDEPAYRRCRATLNSSAKLESLANSAKWEPPHGRFRHFFYPWSEYVKVGAVLRYCAYEVMALHGVLHSEIQAPYNLRLTFKTEIEEAANQAAELVRNLGKDISSMKQTLKTSMLKKVHSSTERLQRAIDMHSYLLASNCEPSGAASKPPSKLSLSRAASTNLFDELGQATELQKNPIQQSLSNCEPSGAASKPPSKLSLSRAASTNLFDEPGQATELQKNPSQQSLSLARVESFTNQSTRKQSRRQYSWPSIEVDAFEEDGVLAVDFLPRMKALESTAALSLANFTSLLIEFVARLDHLVEAVDELSKLAKFSRDHL